MVDRELLEAAARAVGMRVLPQDFDKDSVGWVCRPQNGGMVHVASCKVWNPIAYDGDAFRLAVQLGLHINHFRPHYTPEIVRVPPDNQMYGTVEVQREDDDDPLHTEWYKAGADVCAATRRAITRAAAALAPVPAGALKQDQNKPDPGPAPSASVLREAP